MDNKSKYLSELADLASPYFKKNFQSHKLLQPTPPKFTSSQLSDIFPDSNPRFIAKVKKPKKFEARPTTASANSAAILAIEQKGKLKKLSHSEKFAGLQKYIHSLKFCTRLNEEITMNFLQVSSEISFYNDDNLIPVIPYSRLSREGLVTECQKLSNEFRAVLTSSSQGRFLETIWRAMIKLIDYSFILSDNICNSIKRDSEELSDYRLEQVQKQYENLSQTSIFKIQTLNEEIEKLHGKILGLEQELSFKVRIISEREKKIEEMNSFENKEYTIFKLGRMIKGLSDFIHEAEIEHDMQEKTLAGISKIFEIGEKLTQPPEKFDKESQTNSNSETFGFPLLFKNQPQIFQGILQDYLEKNVSETFTEEDILKFCLEVLKSEPFSTYEKCFIAKGLEKGYKPGDFFEIIQKILKLDKPLAKIFKTLLSLAGPTIGSIWKFVKTIENSLKTTSEPHMTDLEKVYSFLYKIFHSESYKIHRIMIEIEIFEFSHEKKMQVPTNLRKVEINLIRVIMEVKKKGLKLKTILNNSESPGIVSRGLFVTFITSLPLYLVEREVMDLWSFLTGSYSLEGIKIKQLLTNMKIEHYFEIVKSLLVDKFEVIVKCLEEWNNKQEKIFSFIEGNRKNWKNCKDIVKAFKQKEMVIGMENALEIFLSREGNFLMSEFNVIQTLQNKKRSKSAMKT
jgi:hypothetical protein